MNSGRLYFFSVAILLAFLSQSLSTWAITGPTIVINEIAWKGTIASSSDEWMELYNPYDTSVDLTGWSLRYRSDPNHVWSIINLSGTIDSFSYLLIERNQSNISTLTAQIADPGSPNGGLNDTGENVQLVNDQNTVIDEVERWYVSPSGSLNIRSSMERINPFLSGTLSNNWAINDNTHINDLDAGGNSIYGTPLQLNSATGLLFGFGYHPTLPGSPPSPTTLTATQVDHRVTLNWQEPAFGYTGKLTINTTPVTNLSSVTTHTYQPTGTATEVYKLFNVDAYLQESSPFELSSPYYLPQSPEPEELLINELQSIPQSGEKEWIEIYNSTSQWLDLSSCALTDAVGSLLGSFISTNALGPFSHFLIDWTGNKLNDGSDTATLTCQNTIIDSIFYGDQFSPQDEPEDLTTIFPESEGFIPSLSGLNTLGRTPDGNSDWTRFPLGESDSKGTENPDLHPVPGLTSITFRRGYQKVRFFWEYADPLAIEGMNIYSVDNGPTSLIATVENTTHEYLVENITGVDTTVFEFKTFNEYGTEANNFEVSTQTIPMVGSFISEVLPYPRSTQDPEWIEFWNSSDSPLDLAGYTLDITSVTGEEGDPQASIEFCPDFSCEFILSANEYFVYNLDPSIIRLGNTGGTITLFNDESIAVDSMSYANAGKGISFVVDENIVEQLYHPTPGSANVFSNATPEAIITVQGSGSTACMILNFNTTGASSTDPDGDDLTYSWTYRVKDGATLYTDTAENPLSFRLTTDMGTKFTAELTVTDPFGLTHTATTPMALLYCNKKSSSTTVDATKLEIIYDFSSDILITEILPNPQGPDDQNEFVELWNSGRRPINLNGWSLRNSKKRSLDGYILPQNQYLVIWSKDTTLSLKNTGDTIDLVDPNGDTISSVTYPKAGEGQSYSFVKENEYIWTDPSPSAATPVLEEITLSPSAIMITRILPNPEGDDKGNEWIEIKNTTTEAIPLRKWKISNKKTAFEFTTERLPPLSSITIKDSDLKFSLVNSQDTLTILSPHSQVHDSLQWKNAESGKIYHRADLLDLEPDDIPITALVTRVVDGDTLVIKLGEKEEKIRLLGVDTPETVHPFKPIEFYGKEASSFTRRTLEGQTVRLEFDKEKRDKYDRLLAYIYLNDLFFNAELIKQGYAFAYLRFPFKYSSEFAKLENEARQNLLGIWASKDIEKILLAQREKEEEDPLIEEEPEVLLVEYDQTGWENVYMTEVFPNPEGVDELENEYIEIANLGKTPVKLRNWKIVNQKDKVLYKIAPTKSPPKGEESESPNHEEPWTLHPQEYIVLPNLLYHIPNSKATISLIDPYGDVRDTLSYEKSVKVNHAFVRNPVTLGWTLTSAVTPGKENPIVFTASENDRDSDGISDEEEEKLSLSSDHWDTDGDGLSDDFELTIGTDPLIPNKIVHAEGENHDPRLLGEYQKYLRDALTFEMRQTQRTLRFFGTSKPYTRVKLTLHSEPQEYIIPVNSDGSWLYKIENYIESGNHKAMVAAVDPNNISSRPREPIRFALVESLNKSQKPKVTKSKSGRANNVATGRTPITYRVNNPEVWNSGKIASLNCPNPQNCAVTLQNGRTLTVGNTRYQPHLLALLIKADEEITYTLDKSSSTPVIDKFKVNVQNPTLFSPHKNSSSPMVAFTLLILAITSLAAYHLWKTPKMSWSPKGIELG